MLLSFPCRQCQAVLEIESTAAGGLERLQRIEAKLDARTGQVVEQNPAYLRTGEAAVVKFVPLQPIAIEAFKDFPQLGRFALRDMGTTIGAGIVLEIES